MNKLGIQLVTNLMAFSDLVQGYSNKSDTVIMIEQECYTRLTTQGCTILLYQDSI